MPRFSRIVPALLLLVGPGLLALADEDKRGTRPAVLPCKLGLEGKWETFQARPLAARAAHALMQEDPEGQNLIRWDDARHSSLWGTLDRRLAGQREVVDGLRKLQEGQAGALLDVARRSGDFARVIALCRRYPWAASVHETLIALGEQELRQGHAGLALRCFQDVLARSADPALRKQAQVGLWMALAQESADGAVPNEAFANVSPDALFPWMGGELSAAAIRARLTADRRAPREPAELAALDQRVLRVPPSSSWVFEHPVAHAGGLVVGGPNLLAWYNDDSDRPAWSHSFPVAQSRQLYAVVAPGPFQPAAGQGRVFSRWEVTAVPTAPRRLLLRPSHLTHVAAFDCTSGGLLWSTSSDPAWEGLSPASDPTLAEGRLYLLAVLRDYEFSPIFLVCLDPDAGRILWKRELIANHTTLRSQLDKKKRGFQEVDVTHFGNAVTVAGGAVYCQTNMGLVARCDARDGLIEWARTYPRDPGGAAFLTLVRRQGAPPLLAGQRVLCMPRDALGVFALDRSSGELLWEAPGDASLRAVGISGDRLFLADSRRLAALDAGSGKVAWEKQFDNSIENRVVLDGPALYAGTPVKLYRLAAQTGEVVEERDWGNAGPLASLVLHGKTLVGTVEDARDGRRGALGGRQPEKK